MGSVKQPLEQTFVLSERRPHLGAAPHRGQSVGGKLHGTGTAGKITAGLRHSAARILDKRADNQVGAHRRRLGSFGKFTVAVVHHDIAVGRLRTQKRNQCADLFHAQGFAVQVALGALNENDLYPLPLRRECPGNCLPVKTAVRQQIRLPVFHTEIPERTVSRRSGIADNLVKRVIRFSGNRKQNISRAE